MLTESLHAPRVEPIKSRRLKLITDRCRELFDYFDQYGRPSQLDDKHYRMLTDEAGVPIDSQGAILVGFSIDELGRRVQRFVSASLEVCEMEWSSDDITLPRLDYVVNVKWDEPLEVDIYDNDGWTWIKKLVTTPITEISLAIGNDGIGFVGYLHDDPVDLDFGANLSLAVSKLAGGFERALRHKLGDD